VKILYLTHQYFPRHVGGTEVYTRGLARRAAAAGHDVRIVTCHENPSGEPGDFHVENRRYEDAELVEIHFNLSVTGHPARCEYDNSFVGNVIAGELRLFRPDIVHLTHAMKLSGAALEACYAAEVPVIVTLCDFWFLCPRTTLLKWDGSLCDGPGRALKCARCLNDLHGFAAPPRTPAALPSYLRDLAAIARRAPHLKRLLLKAHRIVALSEFQKQRFVDNGFPAARIEVIPHGLEIDDLAGAQGGSDAPRPLRRIGLVGSLVPQKGAHVVCEALALLPDLAVECLIYGPLRPGDYGERLRALAANDTRIRLMGGFEPSQLGRVLDSFDLLAVPAQCYENEPLVLKAALYRGQAVLASRIGSLVEMVGEGRNGWLVEAHDPVAWAQAIRRLARKPLPRFAPGWSKTMDETAGEMLRLYEHEAARRPHSAVLPSGESTRHLIDDLAQAAIQAPTPDHVAVQPITIARQTRMCLFQHPVAEIGFPPLSLGAGAALRFGIGLKQACWERVHTPVIFTLRLRDEHGREHTLFEHMVDVRDASGRRWLDQRIDLSRFANQTIVLRFITRVPDGADAAFCWSGWSDPVIVQDAASLPAPATRADRHRHILMITADALRADHLGCYGHPLVKTPHLDALARDGCLFRHARAQTPATLAAYATILTGRHVLEHGVVAEWGRIPAGMATLPQLLAARGYHTVVGASEAEIGEDPRGLTSLFEEAIPCLAVPAQSGDITSRQFIQWLDRRPDRPFFAWLQFFDTHPPAVPPEPFRSLYYQGDPADPSRRQDAEAVAQIRGMESVLEMEPALTMLPRGQIDAAFIERLQATADVLTGATDTGPDLAAHLTALWDKTHGAEGAKSLHAFGQWLAGETTKLRHGEASAELIDWLREILPILREIETEIVSWLEGVTDFRYPLAMYMSEVSHLDHHVGRIVQALKARGLYDRTTILFTSPHGELLGEHGIYFHHHALMEGVLRVPSILKPTADAGGARGVEVDGVFDQIDILPTLLEAAGLPPPGALPGQSRWPQAASGAAIPEHDSIAVDYHKTMYALCRPPHVFLKAAAPYYVSDRWQWHADERALFELRQPMDYSYNLADRDSTVALAMEQRLEEWRRRMDGLNREEGA
jgi:glycosyltransferase involved in cell wall biosynthesis